MKKSSFPIRLVAVDLDGTLLTSPVAQSTGGTALPTVLPIAMATEGARLLNTAARNGIHVVLVTGRVIDSVRALCSSLETTSPVVCNGGAEIYSSIDGTVWKSITFPKDIGLYIARLADAHGWELSTTVGTTTYFRQRPGQSLGHFSAHRAIVAMNADAVTDNPIRILVSDPEAIREIMALWQAKFSEVCRIEPYHAKTDGEITSLGILGIEANKGSALGLVLERLGVSRTEVMAIGDDLNDLPMFAHAEIRIAMDNAQPQLKEHATAVAPSNDAEGVAWALKEFGVSK